VPAVWKVDASGEHISQQTIRISGSVRDGHIEVRDGLNPGDRVVLNPSADLQPGDRVKAK
jgi:multidrug efflux pump subunit AcrA (membrane-fusion protein)